MDGQLFADPELFHVQELVEVQGVVDPLGLNVLSILGLDNVLPVGDVVSDGWAVGVFRDGSSGCQDNEFEGVPGYLCGKIEIEVSEEHVLIGGLDVDELLVDLVPVVGFLGGFVLDEFEILVLGLIRGVLD